MWKDILKELKLQLPRETYDRWLRYTTAKIENDHITVYCASDAAKEWLEQRINGTVARVASSVLGRNVTISYTTKPPSAEKARATDETVTVEIVETSPLVPFIQVQKYAIWFWQPIVGHTAFAVWQMLRTLDQQNDAWGKEHNISVELIAQTLGVHRQAITGCKRGNQWQAGAFDVLTREHLAHITATGNAHERIWRARVLNSLPYVTPAQLKRLPREIQERHDKFLLTYSNIDREWWESLSTPTLTKK